MGDVTEWGEAGRKYVIHKETLTYFRKVQQLGTRPYDQMTPEELRAVSLRRSELFAGQVDFEGSEKQFIVPAEGNPDGVPVTVYRPREVTPVPAVWVFFHGGGMVSGSRASYATMLKTLSKRAGCVVVNTEYRLAPEHRLPASFDDCGAVARWALANKLLLGAHEHSAVGVGGDSAGGQLAASVAHDVKELAFQILIYPHTDLTLSAASYKEFESTPGLNVGSVQWFNGQSVAIEAQRTDPVTSPAHRPSFAALPPALCLIAQLDPIRDDALEYCQKLRAAQVPVETMVVEGAPHGFVHMADHFKELTKEPYDACVKFLRQFSLPTP